MWFLSENRLQGSPSPLGALQPWGKITSSRAKLGVTLIDYFKRLLYNNCTHFMYFIPSCLDILSQYIDSTGKVTSFLRHPLELQYYLLRPK